MPSNSNKSFVKSPFDDLPDDQRFETFDENVINRIMAIREEFDGKKDEPMTVKEGDSILYGKYAGTEISFEGNEYLIMRESDILAVI